MAWLRNSLLPGLAAVALRNGGRNQAWFEAGSVFLPDCEEKKLGILMTGSSGAVHPSLKHHAADFFAMKGTVEAILRTMKVEGQPQASSADHRLHPMRQAVMQSDEGDPFAIFGQIHPDLADQVGLPRETYLAEIRLAAAYDQAAKATASSRPISRNPAATRDIAVVASKSLPYARLAEAISAAGGAELEEFHLFDIYEGKGVPEGSHSLAFALQFRKMGANFTDEEANQARDRIVAELASLGATQRQ
jgi:phenylalanyl-tRNA synthetase beta chain